MEGNDGVRSGDGEINGKVRGMNEWKSIGEGSGERWRKERKGVSKAECMERMIGWE